MNRRFSAKGGQFSVGVDNGPGMGDEAPELGVELLKDIRVIFEQEKVDRMSSASLLRALCEDAESLWATWKGGKPMTPRQLATSLGEFGIVSGTVRFGETTAKGYTLERFADAFSRYLPLARDAAVTPSQATNDEGYDAGQSRHSAKVLPMKELRKSSSDAGCDGVTGSSSEPRSVPIGNP